MLPLPVVFRRHARNRMRWARVPQDDVLAVLTDPDAVTPSILGRFNAWQRYRAGWLRVTFIEEARTLAIIAVTLRSRGPHEQDDADEDDL